MKLKKLKENINIVCGACLRSINDIDKGVLIIFESKMFNVQIPICEKCYNDYVDVANEKQSIVMALDNLNHKINDIISEYEYKNNCKLKISVYNGDKSFNDKEFEGDKILLEK